MRTLVRRTTSQPIWFIEGKRDPPKRGGGETLKKKVETEGANPKKILQRQNFQDATHVLEKTL